MRQPGIDYEAVYEELPSPVLLLTPDFRMVDANRAYLQASDRRLDDLLGRDVFDVFPGAHSDARDKLRASLTRVVATGRRDPVALLRYDIERPGCPGLFEERYWSVISVPILDEDGRVTLIMIRSFEVTDFVREGGADFDWGDEARRQALQVELLARAREVENLNEQLRQAHAREQAVALALQEAMLPAPTPLRCADIAVRYRPATALNVCGDWYDLVSLPGDRIGVAVGDVVGHGLAAAGVMGQLRSALAAVARVVDNPARALDVACLYSRSVEGAEGTSAVQAIVDCHARTITYSCAGHPPPLLIHPDGTVQFLDQATDPPLGARPEHVPRPQARTAFPDGATLVLYTDGLVEQRGEDIDVGLTRLADHLTRHRALSPEALADSLLDALPSATAGSDDVAIVVLRPSPVEARVESRA
ncbi:SpoIIE family protein phosphatase [Frankia sp. CNm7]|uniref:SpoIIE family protein phosphatase n=1 Tax=Frankia nepalensis TaxID=1836974 RepID=A0A937UPP5_9ACTN|nr:SpoIIE family protein phosphatase [Frankia nepalensis]MBL7497628.1 SpoIIE family protein phosphatase [Frankia nepalensis]MBL7510058.1 SpoIIE family protein phosphatase [Frankia nepalensis]MBL7517532.1 SpoIIE family protein phosphatase [Frankia nepalensis]MBL7631079.1 SpoIIE family protein phosphatase [Frankia nepalensis]